MKKRTWMITGGALTAAAAWWLVASSRAGAKKVPYKVVRVEGDFEIRDYPSLDVASATAEERYGAFDSLFRFISGGNAGDRKIAMTAPVLNDGVEMMFIMPSGESIPEPKEDTVTIKVRPAMRVAALRFGGFMGIARERRAITVLRMLLNEHDLVADGRPIVAYYDSPWTPPPFRRNEVMLPLEKGSR